MRILQYGLLTTVGAKSLFTFTNGSAIGSIGSSEKSIGKELSEDYRNNTNQQINLSNQPDCQVAYNYTHRAHYGSRPVYENSVGLLPEKYLEKIENDKKEYLHSPPLNNCKCGLKLLILVKSGIDHGKRRDAIRRKWRFDSSIQVNFIIGKNENDEIDESVLEESGLNQDLIIGDFVDTYRNLTYKSTLGLQWAANECQNYDQLLLVDDDIQLKLDSIFENLLNEDHTAKKSMTELEVVQCLHMYQPKPRALRSGKWKVPTELYSSPIYPASCTGPAMMISNRAVKILADEAEKTFQNFPIDDIFISGILREKTGLKIRKPPGGAANIAKVILPKELNENETIADRIL